MTLASVPPLARRRLPALLALAVAVGLSLAYLRWSPLSPDLAAQVARTDVVRKAGLSSWWTGWFGGLSMPSYSVVAPTWMSVLGVRKTGALATVVGAVGAARLLRTAPRPRAGAAAFAVSAAADLLVGRITFIVGVALAVWALDALRTRRMILGVPLAIGCYFASPLAGLFLGMVCVAVALTDCDRRRMAIGQAAMLLAVGGAMTVLFPGTGTMPFDVRSALIPAGGCTAVALACRQPVVRVVSALAFATTLALAFAPGAVGSNITRLAWIAAAPIVVACASLPRRRLIAVVALVAAWPVADTANQLTKAATPSASAAYYRPLAAELDAERAAIGASAIGQRLEVVDTSNHWPSVYLAGRSLARGWDRQADYADNPIFYSSGALTTASYQRWLLQLAVGWVALPDASLDFAATDEGTLVRRQPRYLRRVWSNAHWTLYRVEPSAPLVTGATVRSVTDASIVLSTSASATVRTRVRYSPYLRAVDPATRQPVDSCVTDDGGWLTLYLPRASTVALTSDFTVLKRLSDADCRGKPASG